MSEENELPEGWVQTTLEEITAPIRVSVQPREYPTLPFIGMEHVESETMRLLGSVPASELKSNAVRFWPSDVLYGRLRPYLNKVLRPDFEGLCSAEFLVFRESSNLDSHYLQYFLNSWNFREFASHLNEGDRPRVDWSQLKDFRFPLPPLPEQHRIVAVIEQQFTRLDAGIAALQRARTKLKRYRAAVLKAAVEGKLTEDWRAEHPTTEPASMLLERILKERRAKWEADLRAKGKDPAKVKYVEPAEPDVERLPELLQGWCWVTLGQVAIFQNGRSFPSNEYTSEGVKLLRPGNLYADGTVKWTISNRRCMPEIWAERNPDLIVRDHELVMNLTAQSLKDEFLGRICITSSNEYCLLNQRLARITTLEGFDRLYALYLLKSAIFRRFVDGLNKGSLIQHMFTSQFSRLD